MDTTDTSSSGSSSIQAVSATNQLVAIRERLQAGLSARLLELKMEMDKEFGTAFVDMESYLRTEKGNNVPRKCTCTLTLAVYTDTVGYSILTCARDRLGGWGSSPPPGCFLLNIFSNIECIVYILVAKQMGILFCSVLFLF